MDKEKLKEILAKYDNAIDQVSKEFIHELKRDSKTYGEVLRRLNLFEKEIMYNLRPEAHMNFIIRFFKNIDELLEEEKNDLPLTNRSE